MNDFLRLRLDWRVMLVGLAFIVTLLVMAYAISDWNRAHNDGRLPGVTTGISPADTVYPRKPR
jgi:hypothetical protein